MELKEMLEIVMHCTSDDIDYLQKFSVAHPDYFLKALKTPENENNFNNIIEDMFFTKMYDELSDFDVNCTGPEKADSNVNILDDFFFNVNGSKDIRAIICNGKYDYYHDHFDEQIAAIEEFMGIKFTSME